MYEFKNIFMKCCKILLMTYLNKGLPGQRIFLLLSFFFLLCSFLEYMSLKNIKEQIEKWYVEEAKKPNIVALGDSLTAGYGVKDSYPEILGRFLDTSVKNCGEGGIRISEISSNIDKCINKDTDIVIFWGGANDLKYTTSLEDMVKEFDYAIKQLSEKIVIVLTIPPNIELDEEKQILREDFNEYLKQRDGIRVVDIYEVLRDKEDGNKIMDSYHLKGVHLNQLGYYVVANMVYKEISEISY